MNIEEINNELKLHQDVGEVSDGYHTFDELYKYRLLYNAALFNEWGKTNKYGVHKSWKHSDGEECFGGGWFIVMAELPTGQISNHYEAKYWDLFKISEKEMANKWDGHTPEEAAERLEELVVMDSTAEDDTIQIENTDINSLNYN